MYSVFSLRNKYRISPNYRTYSYKSTVKPFRSIQITAKYFLSTSLCVYPFELHWLVDTIQMSTHNAGFYKDSEKTKTTKKPHKHIT